MKVLVADALSDAGLELLRKRGIAFDVRTGLDEAALAKILPDYTGLIVRSATRVTRRLLEAGSALRVVARAGVGVDNIDEEAATERGILVMNTPHGNTLSAAEHTLALMLALARNIPRAAQSVAAGKWDRKSFAGVELAGKTLGIVGLGRIGKEVAVRARAFQMRVVAHDPYVSKEVAKELAVEILPFEAVLSAADFLTLHTPLTEGTSHLVGAAELAKMRPGSRLLNVARGGLVDEAALLQALESGHLSGAACDVFSEEPPRTSPLLSHPHFIGTPHLGASTAEAQEKVALQVVEQVADYLTDGKITNAVNLPVPPHPALVPFIELGHQMASFAFQLLGGNPDEVVVECRGELTRYPTEPVASGALTGVLGQSDERITLVNADRKAREHGVRLVHTRTAAVEDYASSLRVTVRAGGRSATLLGVHLARLGARIVELDGFELEFKPHGRFLVVRHQDRPGMVARTSSVLGREKINIAQMVVGRVSAGGDAVSIIRVDDEVPSRVVEELGRLLESPSVRYVMVRRS